MMRLIPKTTAVTVVLVVSLLVCIASLQGLAAQPLTVVQESAAQQEKTVTQQTQTVVTAVAYREQRLIGAGLAPGEEFVRSPGRNGQITQKVLVTYEDGVETSRTVLPGKTVQPPQDQIVLYGVDRTAKVQTHPADAVASDGFLTTPDGETYAYSRMLSCTATAYSCEGYTGTTAIGTTARVGAVAVDPAYIPYGTKLYIVSDDGAYIYGYATAEDCGNFRGYHVDLYFDTVEECWTFGRRTCTVYILSD